MKRTLIFILAAALIIPTSLFARDKDDEAKKLYQNIPLGYTFEYSDPYVVMEPQGKPDDTKPTVVMNEHNQDLMHISVFKNYNKKSLPIRTLIETEYPVTHPPKATNVVTEVNTTGTQYIVKYNMDNLYYTVMFSTFNATDVIVISHSSQKDFTLAPQTKTIIASIKTVKN